MSGYGTHECPAPGCPVRVPWDQLACWAHWYSIPKPLRLEVWAAYRGPGMGSPEHDAAIAAAVAFLHRAAESPSKVAGHGGQT